MIPTFSIVAPHYQPTIDADTFWRGMKCLLAQTYDNFEVLVYHDGPKVRDDKFPKDERFKFIYTKERKNDWGHSNRQRGIKEAKGEYIVHFNPDNILYPNALEALNALRYKEFPGIEHDDLLVFSVLMREMYTLGPYAARMKGSELSMVLTGYPPVKYNIDAMQLVMKRKLWLSYGGWYDKTEASDSIMYPRFIHEQRAKYTFEVLGEHW